MQGIRPFTYESRNDVDCSRSRDIGISRAFHGGILPMCFPAIRCLWFVVNCCSLASPAHGKSYKTAVLNDSTQTRPSSPPMYSLCICLSRHSVRSFVPCTFRCCAIRPDCVWRQLNETRARHRPRLPPPLLFLFPNRGYFTLSQGNFRPPFRRRGL